MPGYEKVISSVRRINMALEITPEQRSAFQSSPEPCLHLHDPETNKVNLLVEQGVEPDFNAAHIDYMRQGLIEASKQVSEGLVEPWNRDVIRIGGQKKLDSTN